MSQYYITKKDSETGKKFQAISEKRGLCYREQAALASKYGFALWRSSIWDAFGGMSSCTGFRETPDKKIWGKGSTIGEYFPKRNSSAGSKIYKEIKSLVVIEYEELNQCIGFNCDAFYCIGFAETSDEYFGFTTEVAWKVKVPIDCEEITVTRYSELFDKI